MISWLDFEISSEKGPLLMVEDLGVIMKFRRRRDKSTSIKEDISRAQIQETGQGQRPARMVGYSSSDHARIGMEAERALESSSLTESGECG